MSEELEMSKDDRNMNLSMQSKTQGSRINKQSEKDGDQWNTPFTSTDMDRQSSVFQSIQMKQVSNTEKKLMVRKPSDIKVKVAKIKPDINALRDKRKSSSGFSSNQLNIVDEYTSTLRQYPAPATNSSKKEHSSRSLAKNASKQSLQSNLTNTKKQQTFKRRFHTIASDEYSPIKNSSKDSIK